MRSFAFQIKLFLNKFRGEVIIAGGSTILSLIGALLIQVFFSGNTLLAVVFFFGFIIAFLLFGSLFNQKRLINKKLDLINHLLINHFGHSLSDNQFFQRSTHYEPEKKMLANKLVTKILPLILKTICDDHPNMSTLNIIIDSGTTLTPVFPELIRHGIPISKPGVAVRIYTNSLSGIEEIHKLGSSSFYKLSERDINLIGGQPLSKYRATTGNLTIESLKSIWGSEGLNDNHHTITLGILTANWILGGNGWDQLSICARGLGHLEFKSEVISNSHYRIIVTPLAKILQLNDVAELNKLLKGYNDDEYREHRLLPEKKQNTYLFTTRRTSDSLSPLCNISISLDRLEEINGGKNFILCKDIPTYYPPGNTQEEVFVNETPHIYIRDNFERAYGIAR